MTNIGAVDMVAGSCDTVAAGTVGLTGLVDSANTVVLPAGLVELAGTAAVVDLGAVADSYMHGIADYDDTVAQDSLVVVAGIGVAVFDIVGSAGTAGTAGVAEIVDLVRTVEIVDDAELAADTADFVAATEWQPFLTALTRRPCFCCRQKGGEISSDHGDACQEFYNPH